MRTDGMISSINRVSLYFLENTGRTSSQSSRHLSKAFPDGIPVSDLIPLLRREFVMSSHDLLFGYRCLCCSNPKLNSGLWWRLQRHGRWYHPGRSRDCQRAKAIASTKFRLQELHPEQL